MGLKLDNDISSLDDRNSSVMERQRHAHTPLRATLHLGNSQRSATGHSAMECMSLFRCVVINR